MIATDDSLSLLVVDDNPGDHALYAALLEAVDTHRYTLTGEFTADGGLEECDAHDFDCVLLDYRLPDRTGARFIQDLSKRTTGSFPPIIVLTGAGSEEIAVEALRAGAADYIPKSVLSTQSLHRTIVNAVEKARLRQAVREKRNELERSNLILSRQNEEIHGFYHTISHELKTPLTSLKEFVCIVLDGLGGPLTDTQREYLTLARESCNQLHFHLNDLLDAARLDTGKLLINLHDDFLHPCIEQSVATMLPIAKRKGVTLKCELAPNAPQVRLDKPRFNQVLANLIGNAIKFTGEGGHVRVTSNNEGRDRVRISVTDTGCGISSDECARIFERLYQVTPSDGQLQGLGLGLSICRDVVRLHGGDLSVESTPGRGSTFSFTLNRGETAIQEGKVS